jgi:hypothetical protein
MQDGLNEDGHERPGAEILDVAVYQAHDVAVSARYACVGGRAPAYWGENYPCASISGNRRGVVSAAAIVRGFEINGPAAEKITLRARGMRERAGTLSGYALGQEPGELTSPTPSRNVTASGVRAAPADPRRRARASSRPRYT